MIQALPWLRVIHSEERWSANYTVKTCLSVSLQKYLWNQEAMVRHKMTHCVRIETCVDAGDVKLAVWFILRRDEEGTMQSVRKQGKHKYRGVVCLSILW